ncbi:MAG: primosomal protein N' [Bacteroidota bacterium]
MTVETSFYIDVILPIPLERMFTYTLSAPESHLIAPGMRVAVPFGKSKVYTGIAYRLHNTPPVAYEAKPIQQVLDEAPILKATQLAHWQWIANYYMCTLGEVVRSGVPSALLLESETLILPDRLDAVPDTELSDDGFLVIEALHHQASLRIKDVMDITGKKKVLPLVQQLVAQGLLRLQEEVQEKYRPKTEKYIRLHPYYQGEEALQALLENLERAPQQRKALLHYFSEYAQQGKPLKIKDFEQKSGVSMAVVRALIKKEIFETTTLQADRIIYQAGEESVAALTLNTSQTKALNDIQNSFLYKSVCLLHGVTGSGKTVVYLKLIQEVFERGGQVLYLLPEIALTAQLIHRLKVYFGNAVAVYHSKYSQNERVEVWNNVLAGNDSAKVIIGARSALFLPFADLKLIIVDEEHEQSFKKFDPAPRYHARDAAIYLAHLHEAKCLLGSATPSIESFDNAQKGKYGLATLPKRYGEVLLPEIVLVDLKEAYRKKRMKGHFSELLLNTIKTTIEQREQVILFQNRRGFAPVLECTTCGHVVQCPNCDVSLTYHHGKRQLRCHYCGYHTPMLQSCPACGNSTLDTKGFGTEQLQEEILELLPSARVARMDLDTTRGKYAYNRLISAFEAQELDILIGTQMVTKGLDFKNVGLVGIMNADALLNFPDYRAHERSFQLMVQVAGRAGRAHKQGQVLIQTYNPHHPVVQHVSDYRYKAFFEEQTVERQQFKYPPEIRMIKITLKHKDFNTLTEASDWFSASLKNVLTVKVLGPEAPLIPRIRNQYLMTILIKLPHSKKVSQLKKDIKRVQRSFDSIGKYRRVRVVYDVDHI